MHNLSSSKKELRGVGGWLAFLIFSAMVIGPILGVLITLGGVGQAELENPQIRRLTTWVSFKTSILVSIFAVSAISIYAGYKLWKEHRPSSVTFMIRALWSVTLIFPVVSLVIFQLHFPGKALAQLTTETIQSLIAGAITSTIWTLYLVRSSRVKNTYYSTSGFVEKRDANPVAEKSKPEIKLNTATNLNDSGEVRSTARQENFDTLPPSVLTEEEQQHSPFKAGSYLNTRKTSGDKTEAKQPRKPKNLSQENSRNEFVESVYYTEDNLAVSKKLSMILSFSKKGSELANLLSQIDEQDKRNILIERNIDKSLEELIRECQEWVSKANTPDIPITDVELKEKILGLWRELRTTDKSKAEDLLEITSALGDDLDFNALKKKFSPEQKQSIQAPDKSTTRVSAATPLIERIFGAQNAEDIIALIERLGGSVKVGLNGTYTVDHQKTCTL